MQESAIFLGRQPIVDREGQIHAYELLFRNSQKNAAQVLNDVAASATVIQYAFGELGVEKVLGGHRGFINVDAALLLSEAIEVLPHDKVVLEILETVQINQEIVDRCIQLSQMGFTLALDDITDITAEHEALLPHISYVKLEILGQPRQQIATAIQKLKRWPVHLLAEKIDSSEDKAYCEQLGCHFFQGYYFAKPTIISGTQRRSGEGILLKLLGQVVGEAENEEIEDTLKLAPDLSINLLRLVNSSATGLARKIDSIRATITILGRAQLQRWIQLLIFSKAGDKASGDPLLIMAASRGKLLELLARKMKPGQPQFADEAFMTGMLSLVDVALGQSKDEILGPLPIAASVKEALLEKKGQLAQLLSLADAAEQSDFIIMEAKLASLPNLTLPVLANCQVEAMDWANLLTA